MCLLVYVVPWLFGFVVCSSSVLLAVVVLVWVCFAGLFVLVGYFELVVFTLWLFV